MSEILKIRVNLFGRSFECEGREAVVLEQYERFLQSINTAPQRHLELPATRDQALDATCLILLQHLRSPTPQTQVSASELTPQLRDQGVNTPRVDRLVLTRPDLIVQIGRKRGTKYALTEEGIRYAEALATRLGH